MVFMKIMTTQEISEKTTIIDPFWIVFAAFLLTFQWFFIRMIFFDPGHVMKVFKSPYGNFSIGHDLQQMLSYPASWLNQGTTPYIGQNNYPPVTTLLFSPLIYQDFNKIFVLITTLTLVCFLVIAFLFPLGISKNSKVTPLLVLIFIVGLISYGFQYEIERGQFNVIAMALCFSAIYLFHKKPRLSWLAYVLFTIAIQLKLYPAIFILFFVRDWKAFTENLKRFLGLGFVNFALFFALGWGVFEDFLIALRGKAIDPMIGVGNLSIRSFTQNWLPKTIFDYLNIPSIQFVNSRANLLEIGIFLLVIAMVIVVAIKSIQKRTPGIDPYLLLNCTCAALLIPPVSHDYKLPILVGPVGYLLFNLIIERTKKSGAWMITSGLIFLFSLAYFSTQYSYQQKSPLIANNFSAVFLMMAIAVVFSFIDNTKESAEKIPPVR